MAENNYLFSVKAECEFYVGESKTPISPFPASDTIAICTSSESARELIQQAFNETKEELDAEPKIEYSVKDEHDGWLYEIDIMKPGLEEDKEEDPDDPFPKISHVTITIGCLRFIPDQLYSDDDDENVILGNSSGDVGS